MKPLDGLSLGILLILTGAVLFVIIRLLLSWVLRMRPAASDANHPVLPTDISAHHEAVIVIERGGRILSINDQARQVFGLQPDEAPNLERILLRVHPAQNLMSAFAAEGTTQFSLGGRLVQATSYALPGGNEPAILVSLHFPEFTTNLAAGENGVSAQTLQFFTQLTQDMAASLDLETSLQAILQNVEKLIPADFMEITVWDDANQYLIPYRFVGLPGVDRTLQMAPDRYHVDDGFSGYLIREHLPLVIPEVDARTDLHPYVALPIKSYVGVPLVVGKEFAGTLELGSLKSGAFHEQDVRSLELLSGQAAIGVHNALLYRAEKHRSAELSGLAQLSQAFGSVRDTTDLFNRLVQSIAPLLNVEIMGFLLYNENTHMLEAQPPFQGMPDPFVSIYRTNIQPGSPAEQVLLDQDLLMSENAAEDPIWETLGLIGYAHAASLRDSVLVPLTSGGRILGYLQASNHRDGSVVFSQDELHLLLIIATQAAPVIENATLVQQSRQRAHRAEALRRLASLASSTATLDEILQYSLQELARLLHAQTAVAFLLDENRGELVLHDRSIFGAQISDLEEPLHLGIEDPQFHFTVTGGQHTLESRQTGEDRTLLPIYKKWISALSMNSAIAAPLVVRDQGVGELWLGSHTAEGFDRSDLQMLATAAGQLAGVVERTWLSENTDESLRQRLDQLTSLTRISRELSTSLDLHYLLQIIYDEALRTTHADCGSIMLFDPDQKETDLQHIAFSIGDTPTAERTELEQAVIAQNSSLTVEDYAQSTFLPPHEGIQTELVVPVVYQGRLAGLIDLHARSANRFDASALDFTQTLAVQAAVVLGNAIQYQEQVNRSELLNRRVETLAHLFETTHSLHPDQPLEESLTAIALGIQETTSFQTILISVTDEQHILHRRVGVGLTPETWEELQSHTQPWQSLQSFLNPEYRYSRSYFIPADQNPAKPTDAHTVTVLSTRDESVTDAWDPEDMLLLPLLDADGEPLGLISVDAPTDHRRPDRPTFDALEIFGVQATIVLENHHRMEALAYELDTARADARRASESARTSQIALPTLLHKDFEQTLTLHRLSRQFQRIRDGLEVAELASQQATRDDVLTVLAREVITRLDLDAAVLAVQTPAGPQLIKTMGRIPTGTPAEALLGQRNPLRQSLLDGEIRIEPNLEKQPEWNTSPLLHFLEARSFICLPLMGSETPSAILAVGQRSAASFSEEDRSIFEQLSRQVTISLQNLALLTETRRRLKEMDQLVEFSRQLGSLEPENILTTLVESLLGAVPAAQAGMVALWDARQAQLIPQAAMGYADVDSMIEIAYHLGEGLPGQVYVLSEPRRVDEVSFVHDYNLPPENLVRYRKATGGRLPVSALLAPIRTGESTLGVLLLDNFTTPAAFSAEDEALAISLSQQTALALENARLFQDSQQHAAQLQALTNVASTLTSSLRRDELIASLLNRIENVIPYDTGTLWLRQGPSLTVASARGFMDNDERVGITAAVEDSLLFREMISTRQAILSPDVRTDPRFPSLVEMEHLSWLGLPLISKNEMIGLIALEKTEADFYTPEHVQAATTFASQAAVALENARLYEESVRRAADLSERSQRLALLNRFSSELSTSLDPVTILNLTSRELSDALKVPTVSAVLFDIDENPMLVVEVPEGEKQPLPRELPDAPLFQRLRQSLGIFHAENVFAEPELEPLLPYFRSRGAHSLLALPLFTGVDLHGVLLAQTSYDYHFTSPEIELARTISNQAGIAVQNARLFAETRLLTNDLEQRVEARTAELSREHRNSETLLRVITELSASLDMGQVMSRTLSVLGEVVGAEQSGIYLDRAGTMEQYYHSGGRDAVSQASPLYRLEEEVARWVSRMRKPVLVADASQDERWENSAGTSSCRSLLVVPLVLGEEVLGSLLLSHPEAERFTNDQVNLVEAAARQISITINNSELFNLIRDQSERLGGMLRDQQIEASRSRAILEAVADGVLVTDAGNQITLLNASAERILELEAKQVVGKSMDQLSGLFGKAGGDWLNTIRRWSRDPESYHSSETYAEQITLENEQVVAVHLAPVIWRSELLGTVSIFRDITHEVQVDRLKTEFVANVSHELRTPMTSIKGYVDVMLMGASGVLSEQQRHFLSIVKTNTERLGVLVNDLLDVSRLDAGRVTLSFQPLDLNKLAQEVVTDIQRRSSEENKTMNVQLDASADLPRISGDLERVRQVIGNLVGNAYNYTPENGHITIRLYADQQELRVDVQDDGIGIMPDRQPRIFERFYRGEDPLVLATAGTGLGLSISKTLVEMHHGRIWFASSGVPGEGSTFSVAFPILNTQVQE